MNATSYKTTYKLFEKVIQEMCKEIQKRKQGYKKQDQLNLIQKDLKTKSREKLRIL